MSTQASGDHVNGQKQFQGDEDESKVPLLGSVSETNQTINGGDNNGIYYDSFPRIGSPTPILSSPDSNDEEPKVIQEQEQQTKVYKRRWYILILFSLFASTQNGVWNTWGPISNTSEVVFGWNDSTIALLNNWGPITFILSGLFFPWLLQVKGLRATVLSSTILISIGCSLRVITSHASTATILIHMGQFLNGLAGPAAMGAAPQVSSTWFPVQERITATALSTSIGVFGTAVTFVLGPALVLHNDTKNHNYTDTEIEKGCSDIMYYMYYMCGWSWIITLLILVYFPSKPPIPPCVSAVVGRDRFWKGMLALLSKPSFLVIALIYGISLGVMNCWSSVLNINLHTLQISETTSGWLGFYGTLVACVMSLLIGRFADYFARMMRLFIFILYLLGTGFLVLFALLLIKVVPFYTALLYVSFIGGLAALNASVPLMYELACELAFPTSEGSANGVLTLLNNIAGLIFLGIFSVPHIGTMWTNWTVIGSTAVCLPMILMLRGRMGRRDVDEGTETIINADHEESAGPYVSSTAPVVS